MQRFSIAVIPGDGVGQEVVPAALRVLEAIGPRCDASFDLHPFEIKTIKFQLKPKR